MLLAVRQLINRNAFRFRSLCFDCNYRAGSLPHDFQRVKDFVKAKLPAHLRCPFLINPSSITDAIKVLVENELGQDWRSKTRTKALGLFFRKIGPLHFFQNEGFELIYYSAGFVMNENGVVF